MTLAPGEKRTVEVTLPFEAFELVDAGEFEILVGPSSRDALLLKTTLRVE